MVARKRLLAPSTTLIIRFVLIVLLASAAFLFFARESNACSFAPPGSPLAELQKSTYVFAGEVIAVHPVQSDKIYEFRVDRVWKGPLNETAYVRGNESANAGTSCAGSYRPFFVGLHYLVYDANHVASRTGLLTYASEDMAELGEGQRPVAGSKALVPIDLFRARAAAAESVALEEREARAQTARILIVVAAVTFLMVISIGGLLLRRRGLIRR